MNSGLQITLALLKPDVVANPVATRLILDRILAQNLTIIRKKTLHWTRKDAEAFYEQHKGKFFYQRLVEYTTSGPVMALLLEGINAIQVWRQLMGPTKTFQAKISHPYSLRGEVGLTDTRNSTHGSDSADSVSKEIEKLFPELDVKDYQDQEKGGTFNLQTLGDCGCHSVKTEEAINSTLGLRKTWSTYYEQTTGNSNTEWFVNYNDIRDHILASLHAAKKINLPANTPCVILDVGCGNSMIGPEAANDVGAHGHVHCVDFTMEVLLSLQGAVNRESKFDGMKNCSYIHADITQPLPFAVDSISLVIDKGVTDAVMKQPGGLELTNKALRNLFQVLHKGGRYIQITDEGPEMHMDILHQACRCAEPVANQFSVSCKQIPPVYNSFINEYFLYTVIKS